MKQKIQKLTIERSSLKQKLCSVLLVLANKVEIVVIVIIKKPTKSTTTNAIYNHEIPP